jgi:hypothetical protein
MTPTASGLSSPGSRPALTASNFSPAKALRKASAIWLRALLWTQTKRMRIFFIEHLLNKYVFPPLSSAHTARA